VEITTTRRRRRRAGQVVLNVVCAAVMLLAVALIVPGALGLQRYLITGSSMGGSLGVGSVAFEEVVPVNDLRVGDVITYQPPADSEIDHLVTHRIVSIEGGVYRTKGDANPDADPWTFELTDTSQPRVSFSVPYAGWAFIALQDRGLRMLVIGIPATVIALISLGQLLAALRRRPVPTRHADQVATVRKPTVPVG
jgi:signal peptidase